MHSFQRLIDEHRAILARAKTLADRCDGRADPDAAHAALRALADDLAAHLATEDRDIYPRLMLSGDEGAASAARDAIVRFDTLAGDWLIYEARWTRRAILADREGFATETRELIARLEARISVENELLYPMALRGAHITLRG